MGAVCFFLGLIGGTVAGRFVVDRGLCAGLRSQHDLCHHGGSRERLPQGFPLQRWWASVLANSVGMPHLRRHCRRTQKLVQPLGLAAVVQPYTAAWNNIVLLDFRSTLLWFASSCTAQLVSAVQGVKVA
jgi:hypothetical protein